MTAIVDAAGSRNCLKSHSLLLVTTTSSFRSSTFSITVVD
jgi:hypothetical protein